MPIVETREIVDGVMQDPTGPWVVSWYKETGRLGVPDENVVMAAHVDYWDVGPAVFYNIRVLAEGDVVDVTGETATSTGTPSSGRSCSTPTTRRSRRSSVRRTKAR